ncbi:MAG: hypothetical protein NTZ03_16000 [Actinobacteria bacterium]|nr:hypothetical protein [Actinomycetota bacterium]
MGAGLGLGLGFGLGFGVGVEFELLLELLELLELPELLELLEPLELFELPELLDELLDDEVSDVCVGEGLVTALGLRTGAATSLVAASACPVRTALAAFWAWLVDA